MVWGGDATGAAHASSRSNVDLEIGCLIDLATGLVTFTINGKEISTSYQVVSRTRGLRPAPSNISDASRVRLLSQNISQTKQTRISSLQASNSGK